MPIRTAVMGKAFLPYSNVKLPAAIQIILYPAIPFFWSLADNKNMKTLSSIFIDILDPTVCLYGITKQIKNVSSSSKK